MHPHFSIHVLTLFSVTTQSSNIIGSGAYWHFGLVDIEIWNWTVLCNGKNVMCGLINTGITQLHLKTSSKTSKHGI